MNELQLALVGASAAAPPSHILEGVTEELARASREGVPHTIYEEVWHLDYWQQISLDWLNGIETPIPLSAAQGFPSSTTESWDGLRARFLEGCQKASDVAGDEEWMTRVIVCPVLPGKPLRTMSVREQLESMAAHNAYHLGRVVLLRQMSGAWPPKSGGFSW